MITDTTVKLYQKTTAKNSKGQVVNSYLGVTKSISANIQPINFTSSTVREWGNLDLAANSKIMFYYPDTAVRVLDRIVDADNDYYEVRAVNKWGVTPYNHYEALLVPVQGETTPIAVTGVSVTPSSVTITEGGTSPLTATIAPVSATNQTVAWTTSNALKATVNSLGVVTAVSATVTPVAITATTQDGGYTATCSVTVAVAP